MEMFIHVWVNEGLMALFFLLVGLELKREVLVGELASPRNASLPVAGAIGGMLAQAGVFLLATDIAFSVGILALLAWRIPRNLKIFLTALAIADDLGALFYTQNIDTRLLAVAVGIFGILILCNRGDSSCTALFDFGDSSMAGPPEIRDTCHIGRSPHCFYDPRAPDIYGRTSSTNILTK